MAKVIAEAKEPDKHKVNSVCVKSTLIKIRPTLSSPNSNKDDVECMALLGEHLFTGDYGGMVKVSCI